MDAWIFRICTVTYVLFLCIANDAITEALYCYDCGWSSDRKNCKTEKEVEDEEDRPHPLPLKQCITEPHPPKDLGKECQSLPCLKSNSACLRWSVFESGSLINITYKCIGNPDNRKGKFEIELVSKDEKKTHNKKTFKVEAFLCDKDNCNAGVLHHLNSSMLVWTFLLVSYFYSSFIYIK